MTVEANEAVKPQKFAVEKTKYTIARAVLLISFVVIGALGIVALLAIALSDESNKVSAIQNILSIYLPMFGTWVGTILAFYFSRENFEAASKSTQEITREITEKLTPKQILEATKVADAMLPIESVSILVCSGKGDDIFLKADILDGILSKKKRNRLPVLDENGRIRFMLHRSILEQFIIKRLGQDEASADSAFMESLTLKDLVSDDELNHYAQESFLTVNAETTLADVKTLMDHIEYCSDIFITENGSKDSRVIGWVTNNIVLAKSTI